MIVQTWDPNSTLGLMSNRRMIFFSKHPKVSSGVNKWRKSWSTKPHLLEVPNHKIWKLLLNTCSACVTNNSSVTCLPMKFHLLVENLGSCLWFNPYSAMWAMAWMKIVPLRWWIELYITNSFHCTYTALLVLRMNGFHILDLQFLYLKAVKDGIWVRMCSCPTC